MKKITLILFLFLITMVSFARKKKITIHQEGSADGVHYNLVREHHEGNTHTLKCKDPGNTVCGWVETPKIKGSSGTEYEVTYFMEMVNRKTSDFFKMNPDKKKYEETLLVDGIIIKIKAKKEPGYESPINTDIIIMEDIIE